jgi:hypothetical protein
MYLLKLSLDDSTSGWSQRPSRPSYGHSRRPAENSQTPEHILQTCPIMTSQQHFWLEPTILKTKLWGTADDLQRTVKCLNTFCRSAPSWQVNSTSGRSQRSSRPSFGAQQTTCREQRNAWTHSADLPHHDKSTALLAGGNDPRPSLGHSGRPAENSQTPEHILQTCPIMTSWQHFWPEAMTLDQAWGTVDDLQRTAKHLNTLCWPAHHDKSSALLAGANDPRPSFGAQRRTCGEQPMSQFDNTDGHSRTQKKKSIVLWLVVAVIWQQKTPPKLILYNKSQKSLFSTQVPPNDGRQWTKLDFNACTNTYLVLFVAVVCLFVRPSIISNRSRMQWF